MTETSRSRPLVILAASVAVLLSAFAGVALSTQPVPDEKTLKDPTSDDEIKGCERGNWPRLAFGAPKEVQTGTLTDVAVWLDFDGWHIRNGTDEEVTGKVYAVGRSSVTPVETPEGTAAGTVVPSALDFTLERGSVESGVDFTVNCDFHVLAFELTWQGAPVPADRVRVGQTGYAEANPVTLRREMPE